MWNAQNERLAKWFLHSHDIAGVMRTNSLLSRMHNIFQLMLDAMYEWKVHFLTQNPFPFRCGARPTAKSLFVWRVRASVLVHAVEWESRADTCYTQSSCEENCTSRKRGNTRWRPAIHYWIETAVRSWWVRLIRTANRIKNRDERLSAKTSANSCSRWMEKSSEELAERCSLMINVASMRMNDVRGEWTQIGRKAVIKTRFDIFSHAE